MFGTIGKSMLSVGGSVIAATLGIAAAVDVYEGVKSGVKGTARWVMSPSKSETRATKKKSKAKKTAVRTSVRRQPAAFVTKNRKVA